LSITSSKISYLVDLYWDLCSETIYPRVAQFLELCTIHCVVRHLCLHCWISPQAVDHVAYFFTGTTGTSCINNVTPFATQQVLTVTTTNQLTRCRISFSGATCQSG